MRVLIVKISSMGDLIHALPALTDAMKAIPGIRFDWVVEKGFSEVPLWHPAVDNVITTSHRLWKRKWWQRSTRNEFFAFFKKLRSQKYDLVIDAQSSIKSAVVTAFAKGFRFGMDRHSVREWGANWVYQKKIRVPRKEHAMLRLRQLFAGALGYSCPNDAPDFSIDLSRLAKRTFDLPSRYLVFVHNASWASKCYPEGNWHQLIQIAGRAGYPVLLPWGNAAEKQRAQRLALQHENTILLPETSLSDLVVLLSNADGAVCCDTGLGHLAAALSIPTLTLYGPTDPTLLAIPGKWHVPLKSMFECSMCYKRKCSLQEVEEKKPLCLNYISPEYVWERLSSILS